MDDPVAMEVVEAQENLVGETESDSGVDWVRLLFQEGEQIPGAIFQHDCHRCFL